MKFNNKLNEKLNSYPNDFSVCDFDGVCRCEYGNKTRLIIYDTKYPDEPATNTQLESYYKVQLSINWSRFDEKSGIFIIRHNDDVSLLNLYKIRKYQNGTFDLMWYSRLSIDEFYELVSVKDCGNNPKNWKRKTEEEELNEFLKSKTNKINKGGKYSNVISPLDEIDF